MPRDGGFFLGRTEINRGTPLSRRVERHHLSRILECFFRTAASRGNRANTGDA